MWPLRLRGKKITVTLGVLLDPKLNWKQHITEKEEILLIYVMEFHRTGHYDLMYMKTKELGWKDTQGIQNMGIKDSQGNRIVDQKQVLKIWENYVTELYDRPNRPETLEIEPEEEVDTDEKGPYILQSEVEKSY